MMMTLSKEQVFDTVNEYTNGDTTIVSTIIKNWVSKFKDLNILGIKIKRKFKLDIVERDNGKEFKLSVGVGPNKKSITVTDMSDESKEDVDVKHDSYKKMDVKKMREKMFNDRLKRSDNVKQVTKKEKASLIFVRSLFMATYIVGIVLIIKILATPSLYSIRTVGGTPYELAVPIVGMTLSVLWTFVILKALLADIRKVIIIVVRPLYKAYLNNGFDDYKILTKDEANEYLKFGGKYRYGKYTK